MTETRSTPRTQARVEGALDAPPEKVWAVLREFGDLRWGNISNTELQGEGIGCVRVFTSSTGVVVRERLETFDDATRTLSYAMLDSPELPWTDYVAQIELTAADGGTKLEWDASFVPRHVTAEQAQAIVRAIFENGIRNLRLATGG